MFPRKYGVGNNQLMSSAEVLMENRVLCLTGIIGMNAIEMAQNLRFLAQKSRDPIKIEIISPGGDVFAGFALYDVISALNQSGIPIYTVGHAAYSMAALILAVGAPGHRYIYPKGTVMLHAASVGAAGMVSEADLKILRKNDAILVDMIAELCQKKAKTRKELHKRMVENGEEFWFDAAEAKKFGLVDYIVTPDIDRELFGNLVLPSWDSVKETS